LSDLYVKNGEPAANVILADDRVEGVNGLETQPKFSKSYTRSTNYANARTCIPADSDWDESATGYINGQPDFIQPLEYENQKVVNYVYARLNTNASTRFTFY